VVSRPSAEAEIIEWAHEGIQLALAGTDLNELNIDYTFLRFAAKDQETSRQLRRLFHPRTGAVVSAIRLMADLHGLQQLDATLSAGLSWLSAIISGQVNPQDQLRKLEDQLASLRSPSGILQPVIRLTLRRLCRSSNRSGLHTCVSARQNNFHDERVHGNT